MSIFNFWKTKEKKFEDALDTAVFTTKFVINENKDITYVTHDEEDGSWQFLSDDTFDDYRKVIMIVGLGEIIKRDKTILELADMPAGYFAVRDKKGDKWTVDKMMDSEVR